MEGSSFDRLTRRLAVTTSRRGGIAAIVAGALGIAGISAAEAVITGPPGCGATGRLCASGDDCCSLRCIAKRDGTMRCARTSSNRKKKDRDGGGTCQSEGDPCQSNADCCSGEYCIYNYDASTYTCKPCADVRDNCNSSVIGNDTLLIPCCGSLVCQTDGPSEYCVRDN